MGRGVGKGVGGGVRKWVGGVSEGERVGGGVGVGRRVRYGSVEGLG